AAAERGHRRGQPLLFRARRREGAEGRGIGQGAGRCTGEGASEGAGQGRGGRHGQNVQAGGSGSSLMGACSPASVSIIASTRAMTTRMNKAASVPSTAVTS